MNYNIIATVLKSGGIYDVEYVNRLANGIRRNTTVPYKFVVLSDIYEGYNDNVDEVFPLLDSLPGWWSKVELFRPDFYPGEQILFFDLDTIILGNLDQIVSHPHSFTALTDFLYPEHIGSGVLAWKQENMGKHYRGFMKNPVHAMSETSRGDQEWIESVIESPNSFQSLFPGQFISFKLHVVRHRRLPDLGIPKGAKVLCFHGTPKPHDLLQYNTIQENWK